MGQLAYIGTFEDVDLHLKLGSVCYKPRVLIQRASRGTIPVTMCSFPTLDAEKTSLVAKFFAATGTL